MASAASTIMQPTDTRDFEAFYGLLASKAPGTLPVTIPETIFFNGEGRPYARYHYSVSEQRVVAERVPEPDSGGHVTALVSQWANDSFASADAPVAVARYRRGARTLTVDELTKMLAVVGERFAHGAHPRTERSGPITEAEQDAASPEVEGAGAGKAEDSNHERPADDDKEAPASSSPTHAAGRPTRPAVAIPLVLQRYVAPAGDARHVTTFMMAGTSVMCETFQCKYGDAYTPRHAASGSVASAELWELGEGPGPELGLLNANAQLVAATAAGGGGNEKVGGGGGGGSGSGGGGGGGGGLTAATAEGGVRAPLLGIAWEPASPPVKEICLRQTVLKLLNALRREQGVQILGVIAELIFPVSPPLAPGGAAPPAAPPAPAPPVLTGAFGVCWPGQEARVAVGAADGAPAPFFTALPALSATSAGVGGLPTGTGDAGAAVPTRPVGFMYDEAETTASTAVETAGVSAREGTGVAVPARGKNPTPQPRGTGALSSPARAPQRPGTAPEAPTGGSWRGGGGGAGAGVGARRRFEAEYLHTSSSAYSSSSVERVTSSATLVGGSGSFAAYANNDPGTSSFRSPSTGRFPGGIGYGMNSPAARMLTRTTSPGGARTQMTQRRPGTASGDFFFSQSSSASPSGGRGGGGGGGIHNMDTTTKGHSEAKVWARGVPHSSQADEALRASASTLLQSGRARFALDGALANETKSRRDKVAVPMMTQLSRRLEETRSALASELETNAALQLERIAAKDTAERLMAAARDAEEDLVSATHAFERERAEASAAAAAATAEAARREAEINDLKARLATTTAERDYLRDRVNGERDEMLSVQAELRSLLEAERAALSEVRSDRLAFERDCTDEVKELRTECENLKITNDAVLRDARRLNQEATELRMDNLRLTQQNDKVARLGLASKGKIEGAESASGGHEDEDEKTKHRRLNKQHLNPDELSDLLDDVNERYLESRLVNRTISNNLEVLKQVFHHYAKSERLGGKGGQKFISPRELVVLVRDCKLLEAGVGGNKLTSTAVDQIFVKVNYDRRNSRKGDTVMDFHEFVNALVHIAHMKFVKVASLADKMDALMLEYLLPHAKRDTFYRKELAKKK